jgi:hypothetical protein
MLILSHSQTLTKGDLEYFNICEAKINEVIKKHSVQLVPNQSLCLEGDRDCKVPDKIYHAAETCYALAGAVDLAAEIFSLAGDRFSVEDFLLLEKYIFGVPALIFSVALVLHTNLSDTDDASEPS